MSPRKDRSNLEISASLGDFQKAIDFHEQDLKITKEVGAKGGEVNVRGNLGNAYPDSLGDFQKAIDYCEHSTP